MKTSSTNTPTATEGVKYPPALIHIHLLPENTHFDLPRVKTAAQLLAALGCPLETAIVARGQELLTPDRQIWPEDSLMVRKVMSMG